MDNETPAMLVQPHQGVLRELLGRADVVTAQQQQTDQPPIVRGDEHAEGIGVETANRVREHRTTDARAAPPV